ncbi:GH1 family beta-glucosidase [uncultured Tateyamaria sp.]|uniref:GH1 family beta-glucosidase n=1 Tax=uncultured Tateyamaria sp. TaxID=455651 RepID=UPI0026380EDD|nr:GH1 family beta-glucosidase [uncultured Tateyamaria sp.]
MFTHNRADFPKDFLFGAATSAYQIEGHAHGGAGRTIWDDFAATPGNVVRAEHGGQACDHYHRYEADLDLLQAAGFDAYRFSTSWARVMPDGRTPNPEGLDFYDRLTDAMLEQGLKPCATLYHWELPSALQDKGGWRNRDIAGWLGDFAETIMGRIGDRMYSVATINEFWCVAFLSHFLGHHAPGMRDIRAATRAMHHVLLAHGTAIERMRGMGLSNLGAVFNMEWATPADDSAEAAEAAALYDDYYNHFYVSGAFKGRYPDRLVDALGAHLPDRWQDDFATISTPLDWAGINYYTRSIIAPTDGPWPHHTSVEGPLPKTQMGWEVYPDGLRDFLIRTAADYTGDLPLFVTENGMANADVITNGQVQDDARIAYFESHLNAVKQAIAAGVPVQGYIAWSLMDNYEWALGYEKRFGMVHVDFDSLERTPKASWHAFKAMLNGA